MIKGSLFPWIALACVALFFAGFFANKLIESRSDSTGEAPSYLERLTLALKLSDEQQQQIRGFFDEEDARIREVLENEHSIAIRQSFQEVRKQMEGDILKVLSPDQQELFRGLSRRTPPSLPGE